MQGPLKLLLIGLILITFQIPIVYGDIPLGRLMLAVGMFLVAGAAMQRSMKSSSKGMQIVWPVAIMFGILTVLSSISVNIPNEQLAMLNLGRVIVLPLMLWGLAGVAKKLEAPQLQVQAVRLSKGALALGVSCFVLVWANNLFSLGLLPSRGGMFQPIHLVTMGSILAAMFVMLVLSIRLILGVMKRAGEPLSIESA